MHDNPQDDRALVEFFESDSGKAALAALETFTGYDFMPQPLDVANANFQNGMKAVIARIHLAYARVSNPGIFNNQNPLGFS